MSTLQYCPIHMFPWGSFGWRKTWHLTSFLNEQVLSDFVDRRTRYSPVIKEDGEVLKRSFCLFSRLILLRCIVQLTEGCCNEFIMCLPDFPCSLLSNLNKMWHSITTCVSTKHRKCQGSLWTEWITYLMDWNVPKILSTTKGNAEFCLFCLSQLLHNCHCQYYHISIYSLNKGLVEVLHNNTTNMHHNP